MTLRTTILSNVVDTVISTLTTENILPTSRHRVALVSESYSGRVDKFGRPGAATPTETIVKPLNLDLSTQYSKASGMQVKLGDAFIRISQTITRSDLEATKYITVATEQQTGLNVNTITWASGNTVVLALNSSPDLSEVQAGWLLKVSSSTNSSNDGTFVITAVDNALKTITLVNPSRSDNTDDEVTDSTATGILYNKPIRYTFENTHGITDESTGFFWSIMLQRQHQS